MGGFELALLGAGEPTVRYHPSFVWTLTYRRNPAEGHYPAVLYGRAVAQRIKGTPGITGLSCPRVHIDGRVWHLDVGSSHPGAEEGPKGPAVRRLKRYVSWV